MTTPPPNVLSTCGKQLLAPATNERPKESQKRPSRADKGREKASPASKEENKGEKKDGAPTGAITNGGKRSELSDKPVEIEREVPSNGSFDPTTILTEALQNSFSGAMESGFNDLGNLLSANYQEDNASVDEENDSLANERVEEPPTKKKKSDKGDDGIPHKTDPNAPQSVIIDRLTKNLQLMENSGPAINTQLANLVNKLRRDKLNEELTELKKLHETLENRSTLAETKVNQGVLNNVDETARSTDLKFQKVQKFLIKEMIVIVSVVNKLIPVSEAEDTSTEQEEIINKLMDDILLFANANQELNFRRRELLRPQLNANYRYLCAPSNPVTA